MKQSFSTLIVFVLSIFSSYADDWQTFGNGPGHTGYLDRLIPINSPSYLWSQNGVASQQFCSGDGLIYYWKSTTLTASSINTGEVIWSKVFPAGTYNPITFYDGKLIFQRGKSTKDEPQIFCLDAKSGKIIWENLFDAQWQKYYAPTIANDTVFINGGNTGGMYAFDLATGTEKFFIRLSQVDDWTPTYDNVTNHVYTWIRGVFNKHDPETGTIVNSINVGFSMHGYSMDTISIAKDGIGYFCNHDTLFAVDLASMTVQWQYTGVNKLTPSLKGDKVYAKSGSDIVEINAITGLLERTFSCSSEPSASDQLILTQNSLIASSLNETYVFDLVTGNLQETIPEGGQIIIVDELLVISGSSLSAYKLNNNSLAHHQPIGLPDYFYAVEGEPLHVNAIDSEVGLLANDYDPDDNASLAVYELDSFPQGSVILNPDGSFTYNPPANFSGIDSFTYTTINAARISEPIEVKINVLSTDSKRIKIEVTKDGQPIAENQSVSGIVEGTVTIYNSMHEHAQLYQNFRILQPNEHGHMIDSNEWVRSFTIDTSDFYDGENLISVHAHPHNHHGMPYNTEITIGIFKLKTSNDNPAPNGDTKLPELYVKKDALTVNYDSSGTAFINHSNFSGSHFLDTQVFDDTGNLATEQSSHNPGNAQVIAHLGTSVLGRFRWLSRTPPHGEFDTVRGIDLTNFQKTSDTTATITYFLSDTVGRANYYYYDITIPAIDGPDDRVFPSLDAEFLNISQGDTIIVSNDKPFYAKVKLSGLRHIKASTYNRGLTLWLGNSALRRIDVAQIISQLDAAEDETEIEIPIYYSDVKRSQDKRDQTGIDSSAFALWMDFSKNDREHFPVSEHVHLTSIRTIEREWNYGDPSVFIISPSVNDAVYGAPVIQYLSYGKDVENARYFAHIDGQTPVEDINKNGEIVLPAQIPGEYTVHIYSADSQGNPYTHKDAKKSITVNILNTPPIAIGDLYDAEQDEELIVSVDSGVISNDSDFENNLLTVSLVHNAAYGEVSLNSDGSFNYTPDAGFSGIDSFTYNLFDTYDYSKTTVYLLVDGDNDSFSLPWQGQGGNAQRTGFVPDNLEVNNPVLMWQNSYFREMNPPAIGDGSVFLSAHGRSQTFLSRIDLNDGNEVWRHSYTDNNKSTNPPAYANGNVFIQHNLNMISYKVGDGVENWRSPYRSQWYEYFSPAIADNKVFATGGTSGGMYGYDEDSGSEIFFRSLSQYDNWGPAVANGKAYSFVSGIFNEIDQNTGAILKSINIGWEWRGYDMHTMPVIQGNFAFLIRTYPASKMRMHIIDLNTFKEAFISNEYSYASNSGPVLGSPAVLGKHVYFIEGGKVICYNFFTGQQVLTFNAPQNLKHYQPVLTTKYLIVSSLDNTYIFNRKTGELLNTLPGGGFLALSGDKLVITQDDGEVLGYKLNESLNLDLNVASGQGTLTSSNNNPVYGESINLTFTAEPGYRISRITINGIEIPINGILGSYTHLLENITSDMDIDVEYVSVDPNIYIGSVSGLSGDWQTVTLPQQYANPVIVTTPVYSGAVDPVVSRITNITGNSFDIKVQSPTLSGEVTSTYEATYMVVDTGVFNTAEHGIDMEAFSFDTTTTSYKRSWNAEAVPVVGSYAAPVVFGQVMSYNDANWSTFWSRGSSNANSPSDGNYFFGKHVAEDTLQTRASEQIGCIIVNQGDYLIGNKSYHFELGPDTVTGISNGSTQYTNQSGYKAVACLSAMDGNDGGWAILDSAVKPLNGSLGIFIDEDIIGDTERGHTTEQVAIATVQAVTSGRMKLQSDSVQADNNWTTVTLNNTYDSMVIVTTPVTTVTNDPLVVRIDNITTDSFDIKVQSVLGQDVPVPLTGVSFMVVEEGVYTEEEDGINLEAIKVDSYVTDNSSSWIGEAQTLSQSYSSPAVLGQVMTYNDANWSTFWSRGTTRKDIPTSDSLYVGKHVAQDINKFRADETLGFIVAEAGSYELNGIAFTFGVGSDTIRGMDNTPVNYSLDCSLAVLSLTAMDGSDGGWAVLNGAASSVDGLLSITIDEDTIEDSERSHTTEQVAYFIINN